MDETSFQNVLAVVDYLSMRGWRIKKSAVYAHVKQGKLRPEADGSFRARAVEKYARSFLKKIGEGPTFAAGLDKLQERRLKAEAEKLEAQASHWTIKAKVEAGLYAEKATFERELAWRAIVFRQGLQNFIYGQTPEMIRRAEGSLALVPDVTEFLLGRLDEWLAVYSEPGEFKVEIAGDVFEKEPLPIDPEDELGESDE